MGASHSKSPGGDRNRRLRTPKPTRSEKRLEKQLLSQRQKQNDAFRREELKKQHRLNSAGEFNRSILEARNEDAPLMALSKTTGFSIMLLRRLQVLFDVISGVVVQDNSIDVDELSAALRLPSDSLLFNAIFKLFDVTQTRSVNFRTWIITLSALSTHASFHTKLKFSFQLLDLNRDGVIERDEVVSLLESIIRHKPSPTPPVTSPPASDPMPKSSSTSSFARILSSASVRSPPRQTTSITVATTISSPAPSSTTLSTTSSHYMDDFLLHLDLTTDEITTFVRETMDAADEDGDGSISYHEYELIMKESEHFYNAFSIDIESICSMMADSYVNMAVILPDDVAREKERLFRAKKTQRQIYGDTHSYGHQPYHALPNYEDTDRQVTAITTPPTATQSMQSHTRSLADSSSSSSPYPATTAISPALPVSDGQGHGSALVKSSSISSYHNACYNNGGSEPDARNSIGLSVTSASFQQQYQDSNSQQLPQPQHPHPHPHLLPHQSLPALSHPMNTPAPPLNPPSPRTAKSQDIHRSTTVTTPLHPQGQYHPQQSVLIPPPPQRPSSGVPRPSYGASGTHAGDARHLAPSPNPFTPGNDGFTPKDTLYLPPSTSTNHLRPSSSTITVATTITPQPGEPLGLPFQLDDYEEYDGSQPFSSLTRSQQINPHISDSMTPEGFHFIHTDKDLILDSELRPIIHPDLLPAIGEEPQVFHRLESGQFESINQPPLPNSLSHVPSNLSNVSIDVDCYLTTVIPESDIIIFTDNSVDKVITVKELEELDVEDPDEQVTIARETFQAPGLAKLLANLRDQHVFD